MLQLVRILGEGGCRTTPTTMIKVLNATETPPSCHCSESLDVVYLRIDFVFS